MEQLRTVAPAWRVFVDGQGYDVPVGATALGAVRVASADLAAEVESGARRITDSRGLDVAPDASAHGGAVFRVLKVRGSATSAADEP